MKAIAYVLLFLVACAVLAGVLKSCAKGEQPQRIKHPQIEWIERKPDRRFV